MVIYFFIFIPIYGALPILLFKKPKKTLDKINKREKVGQKEIARSIEILISLPLKISIIIPITVWIGFSFGGFILWKGLIMEFMPLIKMILISCAFIGFGVGFMHSFLNYIFLDNYLRQRIDYLSLFYTGKKKNIKILKIPLALKVFMIVLLVFKPIQMLNFIWEL